LCVFSKVIPEPSNIKKSVKYVPGPVFGCSIGYKNNSSYFVHNSGRFSLGLDLLLGGGSAFNHFLGFSDWLWQTTGKTHEFALEKLLDLLHDHLVGARGLPEDAVRAALLADYRASGARGKPRCLAGLLALERTTPRRDLTQDARKKRQGRHVEQAGHLEEIRRAAAAA
jgi:hypothetical protein